jgi:predicted Zn-dependent peptidase
LEGAGASPEIGRGVFVHPRKLGQVHICLGVPALAQGDPRHYVAHVLNTLLGGGMSSRLFQEIRERRGKAYSVYSFLSSYRDVGYLGVYVGTKAEWTREVIDLAVEEMFKVAEGKATKDELARAQNQLAGNTLLGLESADSWMSHMTRGEMHHGRQVSLDEITQGVRDVTLDAVTALAREFFLAETMTATVLGDLDGHSVEGLRLGGPAPAAAGLAIDS